MTRYVAPPRASIAPALFRHPVFDDFARWRDWLTAPEWPQLALLNESLHPPADAAVADGPALRFVAQTAALLGDGLHYEQRIAGHGVIATREHNWHDLLNALIWLRHGALKRALNQRQVQEIATVGTRQRSRAQCALTHFDEGGVIVVFDRPEVLDAWDAHDWLALFWQQRQHWGRHARVLVFGHALLEHALTPELLLLGKALAVRVPQLPQDDAEVVEAVAAAIAGGAVLNDPQELRPLPLSGLPGWHADNVDAGFYRSAPCFRPLRDGRVYPPPIRLDNVADEATACRSEPPIPGPAAHRCPAPPR